MIARFPTLPSGLAVPPAPTSDRVPWGTPFTVGVTPEPPRAHLPGGTYTLLGATKGAAKVVITVDSAGTRVMSISASYRNFSDNRNYTINGTESATRSANPGLQCPDADSFFSCVTFDEHLKLTGHESGAKVTSPNGFQLSSSVFLNNFLANGSLTTTVGNRTFAQPANGT